MILKIIKLSKVQNIIFLCVSCDGRYQVKGLKFLESLFYFSKSLGILSLTSYEICTFCEKSLGITLFSTSSPTTTTISYHSKIVLLIIVTLPATCVTSEQCVSRLSMSVVILLVGFTNILVV